MWTSLPGSGPMPAVSSVTKLVLFLVPSAVELSIQPFQEHCYSPDTESLE